MAINFTDSPTNGVNFTQGFSKFTFNSTKGVWDQTIEASAISVYSTVTSLPLSGVADDTLAKVTDTDKLYKWTGTGWYYLDPVNNNPTITAGGAATYALAADGTATVVTLEANDPEGFAIIWDYSVTVGSLGSTATVSQNNNVFTITPSTVEANAGGFTLTFTASDGVNLSTSASEFSLAFAVDWTAGTQEAKIQSSDVEAGDRFGMSVSMSGDGRTVAVGATGESTGGISNAGAAYVFTRSGTTWTEEAKIIASDAEAGDQFGKAIAISNAGNTAIVGATGGSLGGAAYVFTRSGTTWTEEAKIIASDAEPNDYFGFSVSISSDGNTAIVGAYLEDTGAPNSGAAYIFTRSGTTWTEEAKIQASDYQDGDYFGYAVSISSDGSIAIVGAQGEDTGGAAAGAAYVFTRSGTTWTEEAKIIASDAEAGDQFGGAVSISSDGNIAIVSAKYEDTGAPDSGAAYIFTRSGTTWTEEAKIQASDYQDGDQFGYAVSISSDGSIAIVGTHLEDTGSTNSGAAYIFTRSGTTWTEEVKMKASDAEAYDVFSWSVSMSGDGRTVAVGAQGEDTGGDFAGAAYIFIAG